MAPHPGTDTEDIREKAKTDLLSLLEGVRGKKNLVIERSLAGPVGLFVKFSTLQEYGVDKVFFLENDNVDSSQKNVVFLVRGEDAVQPLKLAEQIRRLQQKSSTEHDFSIILVPRRNMVCDKILEDVGVLGDVSIEEFQLYFLPLEEDLLSLELNDAFGDLYFRKDPTCIFLAAKALMQMQQKHGLFPRIIGKGDHAHRLMELLLRMRSEYAADEHASSSRLGLMPSATIESLIIIDREIDFGTCLLTQLTYEGLIDEFFGIKDNQTEVDVSIVGLPPTQPAAGNAPPSQTLNKKRKIQLDSTDELYSSLRDANFATVGSLLNKVARRLASDYETRHTARTTAELRDFVTRLPGFQSEQQSLKIHTNLAEEIKKQTQSDFFTRVLQVEQNLAAGADPALQNESIEELIARDLPLASVLRLLCLESWVTGGLRQKDYENFRRLILHGYGYQHLLTLDALERMQLLYPKPAGNVLAIPGIAPGSAGQGTKTNYNHLRKALRLIYDDVNEAEPDDIAYVYSGYAPLSVRLVQCIIQKPYLLNFTKAKQGPGTGEGGGANGISSAAHGWQGFEDALKAVRGTTFNKVQKGDDAATKARSVVSGSGGRKTVVVMFVGGITRTEVAALRYIATKEEEAGGKRILICTTHVISGGKMMDTAIENGSFKEE